MIKQILGGMGPISIISLAMVIIGLGFSMRACESPEDRRAKFEKAHAAAAEQPKSEAAFVSVGSGSATVADEQPKDSSWMWTDTSFVNYVTDTFGIYTTHSNGMMAMFKDSGRIGYASADGTQIATQINSAWWKCDSLKIYTINPSSCLAAVDKLSK